MIIKLPITWHEPEPAAPVAIKHPTPSAARRILRKLAARRTPSASPRSVAQDTIRYLIR